MGYITRLIRPYGITIFFDAAHFWGSPNHCFVGRGSSSSTPTSAWALSLQSRKDLRSRKVRPNCALDKPTYIPANFPAASTGALRAGTSTVGLFCT